MDNLLANRRSPFGCHCWGTTPASVAGIPDFAAAGCTWVRATRQMQMEVVMDGPGHFDWQRAGEASIDDAVGRGMSIMGILDLRMGHEGKVNQLAWCSPIWAHLDQWCAFVREAVRHYRGRVRCWEVINEPPFFWWQPIPDGVELAEHNPELRRAPLRHYNALLKATAATIRAEDPDAIIVSGSTFADGALLRGMYAGGCKDDFDVLAVHYLNCRHPDDHAANLRTLRTIMAANGDGAKPIWDTETGPHGAVIGLAVKTPGEYEALYQVYRHCLSAENGVERYFWFNHLWYEHSIRSPEGAFQPPYQAMLALTTVIGEAPLLRVAHLEREVHVYVFAAPTGPISVIWSTAAATGTLPGGAAGYDHLGADLTVEAVFAIDGKPRYLRGDILAAGFTATVTSARETVVPVWDRRCPTAETPTVASPRCAHPPKDFAALPLLAARDQVVLGAHLPKHFCRAPSAVAGELHLGHDDQALYLRVRTWDDTFQAKRPWGLVQVTIRDSDPGVAEWPFFYNGYGLISVYHSPRGTLVYRSDHPQGEYFPTGPIAGATASAIVHPDGLTVDLTLPWAAVGPLRPGRHNPFLFMATLSRTDGLFDVPDSDCPEEWPYNFNDTAIVRDPSLVRWITFA
jgi:hypothetical protein